MLNPEAPPNAITQYLRRRGFEPPWYSLVSLKRWWIDSFAQPGFAQFWRLWNPPMGFLLHQLYRGLGGDQNRVLACLGTFAAAGFFHDVIRLFVRKSHSINPELTIAFVIFGMLVLLTSPRRVQRFMRRLSWPVHCVLNAACLYTGFKGAEYIWDKLGA